MEKSKFQDLIQNIEKNRESIILEKEELEQWKRKRKKRYSKETKTYIDIFEDRVEYLLEITLFIFDREGYELFEKGFNTPGSKIIIYGENEHKQGYLCKLRGRNRRPLSFHRWMMSEEIEKFAKENGIEDPKTIHVHHIDRDTTNNRKENLMVMTEESHMKLHNWNKNKY